MMHRTTEGVITTASAARMDQIAAAGGLTLVLEAMMNHPVIKKDEIPDVEVRMADGVIKGGMSLLFHMTKDGPGAEERRITLRKAGVLQVLVPVVAAYTNAEIEAGMHPEAGLSFNKVLRAVEVAISIVGNGRLNACMKGEDPLCDMLTEEDMMVLVGTKEKPGFWVLAGRA